MATLFINLVLNRYLYFKIFVILKFKIRVSYSFETLNSFFKIYYHNKFFKVSATKTKIEMVNRCDTLKFVVCVISTTNCRKVHRYNFNKIVKYHREEIFPIYFQYYIIYSLIFFSIYREY